MRTKNLALMAVIATLLACTETPTETPKAPPPEAHFLAQTVSLTVFALEKFGDRTIGGKVVLNQ